MEAFSRAVALGIRHLETDLHLTSDGVPVCFHDHTLDRTTDGTGPVVEHSFEDLKALDAGYRHRSSDGHLFRGQGIGVPTLEEALTEIPQASFVVDLKTDGLVGPLVALLDNLDAHDRLIVGSFSDDRINEFRDASKGRVATSTGPVLTRSWLIASRVGRGGGGEASALQIPTHMRGVRVVNRRLVETAHEHGLQVHVWTVNEPTEMERLLDFGVDGLVTDRPDLLKEVLVSRDQWTD
jgi:glycerophosphoryl diester phosphodiesterase